MGPPENMHYQEAIKEIVEILKTKYKPEKIVLFGSCVSGKINRDSDIDMLIVKDTKKKYGQRYLEVCRLAYNLKRRIPFEPFVITPQEFKRELRRNLFLQEIVGKGRVLYEKN